MNKKIRDKQNQALRAEVKEASGFFLIMIVAAVVLGVVVHPVFGVFVGLIGVLVGSAMVATGIQSSDAQIEAGTYDPVKRGRD